MLLSHGSQTQRAQLALSATSVFLGALYGLQRVLETVFVVVTYRKSRANLSRKQKEAFVTSHL